MSASPATIIRVLAPQHSIESVKTSLSNTNSVTWEFHSISRKSTKEEVTVACLKAQQQQQQPAAATGYLNLCNGRRGDDISADVFVSCTEVVEALDELQVPFYSGPTLHSSKYNRKDIAALAFYATEEMPGVLLPCHGSIRITKQGFYENLLQQQQQQQQKTQEEIEENLFEKSGEMVDQLRYPVVVKPVSYSHRNSAEEIICNNLKERVQAQRFFFEQGHSSVFVDEYFDKEEGVVGSVSVLCFGFWDAANKKSIVKLLPSETDLKKIATSSTNDEQDDIERRNRVLQVSETLFRGVYDDATCCAPLRGHCLIRLLLLKKQDCPVATPSDVSSENKLESPKTTPDTWIIRDIVPNCTLFGVDSPSAPAVSILAENNLKQGTAEFSNFFASLVEINQAPPRFVELPYRVEYDPKHRWYGLCASRDIKKDEIVFHDEVTTFTIVTKPFVEANWSDELKVVFSRYAWPLDSEGHLYAVWSEDPQKWRPINHHCDPNTTFAAPNSLNCIATRDIKKGETLSLDYATFCDYTMKPFQCKCGWEGCRGLIEPTAEALSRWGKNAWNRVAPKKPLELL